MKYLKYIALMLFAVLSAACESLPLPIADITVHRQRVVALGSNSATLEIVLNPTAATIQSVVASYSTYSDMSNAEECAMKDEGNMTYRVELTNLRSNTTYYVHFKVSNAISACTIVDQFTTKEGTNIPSDTNNNYEYVDLGLSVKWATCNVGATKPEEYGDYFAWGEIEPKEVYNWSTYKWCNGSSSSLTKYCTSSSYGIVDNKTTLELSDDAAAMNWGGNWRMPTDSEMTELREQCIWTWITQNGVKGYIVTSKSNGNSIFLPAAGCREGSSFIIDGSSNGEHGHYWSSSVDWFLAYRLYFYKGSVNRGSNGRCYGQSVRPVYSAQVTVPTVTTSTVTQITETSAMAGGDVTSDGGASVTERGVVYSTSANPTTANSNKVISGSGMGAFTCNLTGLQPNTTYYVRAYAVNSKGTAYGDEVSFTTKEEVMATPKYVDLGLSVKWATFNVGAAKPEEYGDYFAWGETEPKSTYDWSTYSEASDDVAAVKWGGSWRMPTQTEQDELRTQCTWTWTTQNGVKGYRVTGTNGNSIFLPAAGYRSGSSLYNAGSSGYYWSNSLDTDDPDDAYRLGFNSGYVGRVGISRYHGQSVRPVYGAREEDTNNETYFSVSATKKVTFSSGNLQYHPANNKWRFAENQTDYIGDANSNISSSYNGWLDLFGWSTSATNFGVSTSTSNSDNSGSFVDWGTNKIGNDAPNTWRTLTHDEWNYLLYTRTNADDLVGVAKVNGVNGLIFLPDNWVCPAGVTFKSGFHSSDGADYYAAYQTFTADQWSKLEAAGAVFLPAAGYRHGSDVNDLQDYGIYWSATKFVIDFADCFFFGSGRVSVSYHSRYYGQSVRLAKDL